MADRNGDAHAGQLLRDRARLLGVAGLTSSIARRVLINNVSEPFGTVHHRALEQATATSAWGVAGMDVFRFARESGLRKNSNTWLSSAAFFMVAIYWV